MSAQHTAPIDAVLGCHVELAVLSEGVTFSVGSVFDSPFRASSGTLIEISPTVAHSGPALAIHIRHALEIAMWHRLVPGPRSIVSELATAALACWTAARYIDTLSARAATAAVDALPAWLRQLRRLAREYDAGGDRASMAAELVTLGSHLLHLQGATRRGVALDRETLAHAAAATAALLDAALPAEMLLTQGGDGRVSLDAASRLNKYGCSAVPRPSTLCLCSCTASSPSELSYRAAEQARQRLLGSAPVPATLHERFAAAMEETRTALASAIGVDRQTAADVVLAASGTDCELYALHLALLGHDRNVLSIVIGPDEIGSGSIAAASGRHFDALAPLAQPIPVGNPLDGVDVDRLRVETLPLRYGAGLPIPVDEIDASVATLAREAVHGGSRVLLHLVDSSKTGLRAPSVDAVRRLHRELGEALTVVVDAAQMRTRSEVLLDYVRWGWLVMISGSKFFSGPPFSGALLVPNRLAARARDAASLPRDFAAYLSAFEVPPSWTGWRSPLPRTPNFGLLLRWRAALAEMQAFHGLGHGEQFERLRELSRRFDSALRGRRSVELVSAPVGNRDGAQHGWDSCRTIWTFRLKRAQRTHADSSVLTYDEAWQVYVWLNRDISAMLPSQANDSERRLAAVRCHIGQPVRIRSGDGDIAGGLRMALGARSITASAADPGCVLDKIDVILKYWRQLMAQPAVA